MEARIFDSYDILFVGYTVFRGTFDRLYAFGGVSHRGSTLLGLATTCSLPTMFEGIVVPFMDVYGRHSIVHDGCPRFRHYRIRELVERNGISQYSLPSTTRPPQPVADGEGTFAKNPAFNTGGSKRRTCHFLGRAIAELYNSQWLVSLEIEIQDSLFLVVVVHHISVTHQK